MIGAAFLGGALLGGLAMWLSLGARAPVGEPVVAARAPLHQAPGTGGDTVPVSAAPWPPDASLPRQAVIETTGEADSRGAAHRVWSATSPRPSAMFPQHWLSLLVGLLLGGTAAGALASLWATRRAMVRLQSRLGQFERLAAEGKGDWLANLDSDLVGEWRDGL